MQEFYKSVLTASVIFDFRFILKLFRSSVVRDLQSEPKSVFDFWEKIYIREPQTLYSNQNPNTLVANSNSCYLSSQAVRQSLLLRIGVPVSLLLAVDGCIFAGYQAQKTSFPGHLRKAGRGFLDGGPNAPFRPLLLGLSSAMSAGLG